MKYGYKHKTGTFGTDAERYVSQLFLMSNNPNGSISPDLISLNGRYTPKLSIEVKSGRKFKGVMVDYQLRYSIKTEEDYLELFGERPPKAEGIFPGFDADPLMSGSVAYYYNIINRTDNLTAKDLDKPFSSIKLKWGSQFIVPHEFAFYNFAINRSRRSGDSIEYCIDYLKEVIREDVLGKTTHYKERKEDPNSWQDIHGRDILSIFLQGRKSGERDLGSDVLQQFPNPEKILTSEGKERVDLIAQYYPDFQHLRRILIPSPNNAKIHILAKPEDYHLLNSQFRLVVRERSSILEKIARERTESESLLDKIETKSYGLYETGDMPQEVMIQLNLSREEVLKLRRLTLWQTEEEFFNSKNAPLPEVDDEIPF